MKWITTDYKGNKKVWYSEDVINEIKLMCQASNCFGKYILADEILKLIQGQDK